MTEALYLRDAYLRTFAARVTDVDPPYVVLDRSGFYPTGGGQPSDVGSLRSVAGESWCVSEVEKSPEGIRHSVEPAPPGVGTELEGTLDWDRRYTHMRYHTCLHILSGVVFQKFGSEITGGQIYFDRARMDLALPEFDRAIADEVVREINDVVSSALPVSVRFVTREELQANPSLVRVDAQLMPDVPEVRLIDIEGFDVQADGGTHVRSTAEVGEVRLQKIENKGARNKRLHLTLGPAPVSPG